MGLSRGSDTSERQEEGGAKSVQERPKLQIFLALRANNTSEITTILLKMVQFFSKTPFFRASRNVILTNRTKTLYPSPGDIFGLQNSYLTIWAP